MQALAGALNGQFIQTPFNTAIGDGLKPVTMDPSCLERRLLLAKHAAAATPALFLDRDGVIIEDRHHISDPAAVELCPGARPLLRHASQAGWPVVVITNQSGIARGLLSWQQYEGVTDRMLELLGPEAPIAAIYANGHGPEAPPQSWRKPSPAMLFDAAGALHLDLARSVLIGDRLSDLRAGAAAGVAMVCHVLSGHGERERPAVRRWREELAPVDLHADVPELLMLPSLMSFPLQRLACLTADRV